MGFFRRSVFLRHAILFFVAFYALIGQLAGKLAHTSTRVLFGLDVLPFTCVVVDLRYVRLFHLRRSRFRRYYSVLCQVKYDVNCCERMRVGGARMIGAPLVAIRQYSHIYTRCREAKCTSFFVALCVCVLVNFLVSLFHSSCSMLFQVVCSLRA